MAFVDFATLAPECLLKVYLAGKRRLRDEGWLGLSLVAAAKQEQNKHGFRLAPKSLRSPDDLAPSGLAANPEQLLRGYPKTLFAPTTVQFLYETSNQHL